MVMHFSHNKSQKETLDEIRILLKKEGFTVTKYAPEDGFMLTDYKVFNWGTGKRLLSVSVHVHDKVTINGMGKMDIPVSDIGDPELLLNIKTFDRLPYRVQKKTFYTIIDPLEEIGIKQINHWP
tara:strand:+ start:116 stop:487 length:372 start_codon:yes stop_codon:yes gene_type:complete